MLSIQHGRTATFKDNFLAVTYWRKPFSTSTRLIRRRWVKRKHINNWISLSNIMKDWAISYRFQRNVLKSLFYQHLSINSFFTFNLLNSKNSIPALHKGSELTVLSSSTRKILNYFTRFNNPRIKFMLSLKHWHFGVMSYDPAYWNFTYEERNEYVTPLLLDAFETTFHCHQPLTVSTQISNNFFNKLMLLSSKFSLNLINYMYKTLVLTTLLQLHKKN